MAVSAFRMFRAASCVAAILSVVVSNASIARADAGFDHRDWDVLLGKYVDASGRVAYRDLAASDRSRLDAYLERLAEARPDGLEERDRLAFWINAYNAMAVAGVLEGYDAEGLFSRYRFFKSYERRIAGERRTLDEIEHGILRKRFDDFRMHFAVNCASTSCPKLRAEAYDGDRLDAQLNEQARTFLEDPERNRFDVAAGRVELSKIFDWFAKDFTKAGRSLADALSPWLSDPQIELLRTGEVSYRAYDWTLNAQQGQRP